MGVVVGRAVRRIRRRWPVVVMRRGRYVQDLRVAAAEARVETLEDQRGALVAALHEALDAYDDGAGRGRVIAAAVCLTREE